MINFDDNIHASLKEKLACCKNPSANPFLDMQQNEVIAMKNLKFI